MTPDGMGRPWPRLIIEALPNNRINRTPRIPHLQAAFAAAIRGLAEGEIDGEACGWKWHIEYPAAAAPDGDAADTAGGGGGERSKPR